MASSPVALAQDLYSIMEKSKKGAQPQLQESDTKGRLLIGFRNPLSAAGLALLVPFLNPAGAVNKGAAQAYQWVPLIELDLQGRGMRSIEKVGRLRQQKQTRVRAGL